MMTKQQSQEPLATKIDFPALPKGYAALEPWYYDLRQAVINALEAQAAEITNLKNERQQP